MEVRETELPGVLILEPARHGDARGFFAESWSRRTMETAGLNIEFVQDNLSLSREAGTIRGLHYQSQPHAQAKLVSCTRGSITDIAVDIRNGSPTFGQTVSVDLSFENGLQLLVPEGFLHGFVTREPDTVVQYKVTSFYDRDCDGVVHWDSCGIDWEIDGAPVVSDKDAAAPPFDTFQSPFDWTVA